MSADNIQFTKVEIRILKFIFKHYEDKHNARQIAKILSLNHAHVNKLCNSLVEKNLLKKEVLGNSIFYTFNHGNKLSLKFIEYILSLEVNEFPKWLAVLAYNLNKFKEYIKFGCVFGSSIISNKFNDVDVLLVYDKKKSDEVKKIKDEIRKSGLVEKPIRYVEMAEKDIIKNKGDKIFYGILSENLIFHNPTKYIEMVEWLR